MPSALVRDDLRQIEGIATPKARATELSLPLSLSFVGNQQEDAALHNDTKNRYRRLSVDAVRPRRRLDQRRSTTPTLPVCSLRVASPTSSAAEDARSPRVLRHLSALNSPGKRHWTPAQRLCCELRTTEEEYVDDLRRLVDGFFAPLEERASAADIALGPVAELHRAATFLLGVHEELLDSMTPEELDPHPNQPSQCPTTTVDLVGRAFLRMAEFFKVYAVYCAAHRPATDELNALHKKLPWILNPGEDDETFVELRYPGVLSELIKPVQRICRYPMLLRSLADQAAVKDSSLIRGALNAVERVSDLVNLRVRDAQNNARLLELDSTLGTKGNHRVRVRLLRPARAFVCEAAATVSVGRDGPRWPWLRKWAALWARMWRHVDNEDLHASLSGSRGPVDSRGEPSRLILLSDALLMAKKSEHKLQIRRQICLSCAAIDRRSGDMDEDELRMLRMTAAKAGRCRCHHLTPATLRRPMRTTSGGSVSDSDPQPSNVVAIGSNERTSAASSASGRATHGKWRHSGSLPFRARRQYVLFFESQRERAEFVARLDEAIAQCERIEMTPATPSSLRLQRSTTREAATRLWRSLTHPDLATDDLQAPADRSTAPTDSTRWSVRPTLRRERRHVSIATATLRRRGRRAVDGRDSSSLYSIDADAVLI